MAVGTLAGTVQSVEVKTAKSGSQYQVVSIVENLGGDKTQKSTWINFSSRDGRYFFEPKKGDIVVIHGAKVSASAYLAEGESRPSASLSFARGDAQLLYRPPVQASQTSAVDFEDDGDVDPIDDL